jgi:hypothetical protein
MAAPCPHCGQIIDDGIAMCDACADLFATLAPPPPVVQQSPPAPPALLESAPPIPGLTPVLDPLPDVRPAANPLADKAFYASLIGLLVPILSPVALGMAIVSLGQIAVRPRVCTNRAMAISAVAITLVAMCVHGWLIWFALSHLRHVNYLQAHRKLFLAINLFTATAEVPPAMLEDLALPPDTPPDYLPMMGSYTGPYLHGTDGIGGGPVPKNPYATGNTVADHWAYDPETGSLRSAPPLPSGFAEAPEPMVIDRPPDTLSMP